MAATRSHRPVTADIGGKRGFAGLSDRAVPVQLSRLESPDLRNVELAGRLLEKRNGYRRLHTNRLRNASVRLDGQKDYWHIPNLTAYRFGSGGAAAFVPYVGVGVVMRAFPATSKAIASMGHTATTINPSDNIAWLIYFDPTGGAGVGGWVGTIYDVGAGAAQAVAVTDATAVGEYRFLELYIAASGVTAGQLHLKVWKEDGTSTTGNSGVVLTGPGLSSTEPILLGAAQSASGVVDTTVIGLPHATMCELRYFSGTLANSNLCLATTSNLWYRREIEDSNISLFTGYWKCNDGNTTALLADSTATANPATAPEEAVAWSNNQSFISGTSGLKFQNPPTLAPVSGPGIAWVHLKDLTAGGAALNSVFIPTTGNFGNFTFRFLYTPVLPMGATVMPDMCIAWAGHNAGTPNLPQPIGVSIVSDQFVFSYDDNGTLRTNVLTSVTVSSLAGKKLRIACIRFGAGGAGTNGILIQLGYLLPNGGIVQFVSTTTTCTGTAATAVSTNWSFMQHMSAFLQSTTQFGTPYVTPLSIKTTPEAPHPHGLGFGYLDHVQLIHTNTFAPGTAVGLGSVTSLGPIAIYQEIVNWQTWFPASTTTFDIAFNEGGGNILGVGSSVTGGFTATLHPHLGRSVKWDIGLVDPYRDPPGQTIVPYDRFRGDGTTLKETLIISGSTLYKLDEANQLAVPIGAGIFQGPQWSEARYGSDLLLASQNGRRPIRWNGSTIDQLGIEAPLNPVQITTSNAAGTFIPASTYSFYCTYRNKSTGDESNPSPVVTVTFGALQTAITSVNFPVSGDPQVNQRRLWMIPPPGTPGAQAYLLLTVDDNVTIQWTPDITAPVFTGAVMEYTTNQEAPQGSVIATHKDFTYIGGNQTYPTRFFRSVAGRPPRWDHDAFYVDLDLDSGDPIVAAKRQINNLFVSLRDGWARVSATGNTLAPVAFAFTRRDHGATGPSALCIANDLIYYLSERDVYASDGFNEANLSSPEDDPRDRTTTPSIEETMRSGLNDARRSFASMVYHRSKKQVWIACSSAGSNVNDMILVYDIVQRKWSRYDIPASTLAEVDDMHDQSRVFGVVRGYVCRMDEPSWWDGLGQSFAGNAISGSTTGFTVFGTPFAGQDLRGLTAYVYSVNTRVLYNAIVYSNTSSTVTFYDAIGYTIVEGDVILMGAFPWYADFIVDFGDPVTEKRLKYLRMIGKSDNDAHNLVVTIKPVNNITRTWTQDGAQKIVAKWPTGASKKAWSIGGQGTSFRIRVQDSTVADPRAQHCTPNYHGRFSISSIIVDAEELGHVI